MRIGDRPIEIITEDAADDPNQALARAKKLVEQDKVVDHLRPHRDRREVHGRPTT